MNKVIYTVYDGNGNVSELISANDGAIAGHYEYNPFGKTIAVIGSLAEENVFCFPTKYADEETKLIYYGYRYYSPKIGRWLSRDPIGEYVFQMQAFLEIFIAKTFPSFLLKEESYLYLFLQNNSIAWIDAYGLQVDDACCGNPCKITNFRLNQQSDPIIGKAWVMINADWDENGLCQNKKTFWWTCTYQGDQNKKDVGKRNTDLYSNIAWISEGENAEGRSDDELTSGYIRYSYVSPVIVFAKLETDDECGKHRVWLSENSCICVKENNPLCNCTHQPPSLE